MGAIVNGLNLHGLKAFGSTFFNFLDYMKGAVRLSAVMELPVIQVYTHDSIGLGEDGPTHQPIEHMAHLRATPNMHAVRPADANETALAWQFALNQTEGPVCLVLSRQNLPILDPDSIPADAVERGAYVLKESSKGEAPDAILIGTGSEVSICVEAAEQLEGDGVATRVVSMPCWDQLRRPGRRLPRLRAAARVPRSRLARGRGHLRLGALGGRLRGSHRHDELRRLGAREGAVRALRPHRRERGENRERTDRRRRSGMSIAAEVNERLAALTEAGTSVWLDQIRRGLIESGELQRLVDEDSLGGVTSNPAIFEKAILGSDDYDADIEKLAGEGKDASADLPEHRGPRRADGVRRTATGVGGARPRRRLRVARGRAVAGARHRRHADPGS